MTALRMAHLAVGAAAVLLALVTGWLVLAIGGLLLAALGWFGLCPAQHAIAHVLSRSDE